MLHFYQFCFSGVHFQAQLLCCLSQSVCLLLHVSLATCKQTNVISIVQILQVGGEGPSDSPSRVCCHFYKPVPAIYCSPQNRRSLEFDSSSSFPSLWGVFSVPYLLLNLTEDLGYHIFLSLQHLWTDPTFTRYFDRLSKHQHTSTHPPVYPPNHPGFHNLPPTHQPTYPPNHLAYHSHP